MIENITDMNVDNYNIKAGDIKVDSEELKCLFRLLETYHYILCNMELGEEDKETIQHGLELVEYLQNKYLVLGELRHKQQQWYAALKSLDDKTYINDTPKEKVEELKKEVWAIYLEIKTKREETQKDVDKLKERVFLFGL